MKRCLISCILFMMIFALRAEALDVSAHSAILMDADSGTVLYEKQADQKSLIASTTKIMTALVVIEKGELDRTVSVPREAEGVEGSSMYLRAGEELTVRDLLYGLMLSSGNDAAVALALETSGSVEAFAREMNRTASRMGLRETHFANPNGLDSPENYSSARDLAVLASGALKQPEFRKIVGSRYYTCSGHSMTNHNKLLWQYDGALGVKTGFTKKAGRILVGAAERNGRTLVTVTISAPDDWNDHKAMLDFGFSQYQEQTVVEAGQKLGALPVISGEPEEVEAVASETVTAYLLPGEQPEIEVYLPAFRYAPVARGDKLGTLRISLGSMELTRQDLLANQDAEAVPVEKKGLFHRKIMAFLY